MKVSPKWVKSLHLSESDDFDFKNTIDNSKREFSLKLETKNLEKSQKIISTKKREKQKLLIFKWNILYLAS